MREKVLSVKEIQKVIRRIGMEDLTGKYLSFIKKPVLNRPSINDLANAIHQAQLDKLSERTSTFVK